MKTDETEIMLFSHEFSGSHDQEPKDKVILQGVEFNLNISVNDKAFCMKIPHSMERLISFLKEAK